MHYKNEFKDNEVILKFLFKTVRRQHLYDNGFFVMENSGDNELEKFLKEAFQQLNSDEQRIIQEEMINYKRGDWWVYYYSRATYYRTKGRAMKKMLAYLHRGRVI